MQIVADGDAHGSLFRTVFTHCGARFQADLLKFAVAKVFVQKLRRRIVGNVNVRTARVIKIGKDYRHPVIAVGIVHTRCFRNVGKRSVAVVVKQRIAGTLQSARPTLHVDPAILAVRRGAKSRQIVQVEIHVIGHHQIKVAVAIIIAERCASGPAAVGDASLLGHVSESAVAIIFEKFVSAQAGQINIGPAVVVVVTHRSAHGETWRGKPGFFRYVGKSSVMIVVIQRPSRSLSLNRHVHGRRGGEVNIRVAVAIVIDQQNTAAHGFNNVLTVTRRKVIEMNPGFTGDIAELRNFAAGTFHGLGAGRRRRRLWM